MDKATFFAGGSRAAQGVSGLAAMIAAASMLDSTQRGVFFTIGALMQIQSSAELGMSVVIIQVASHLTAAPGISPKTEAVTGDANLARMGSLLRQSVLLTMLIATVFLLILAPTGIWFFTSKGQWDASMPWLLALAAAASNLLPIPFLAVMEGSGSIANAWRIRWWQQIIGGSMLPIALIIGLGNWSLGIAGLVSAAVGMIGVAWDSRFFGRLWASRSAEGALSWKTDVWPFQWRISLSYLCGIFIVQFAVPSIYRICGAVEAGRFGLSIAAMRAVSSIALSNISSKAQILGYLVASGDRKTLDRRFDQSCIWSLAFGSCGLIAIVLGFEFISHWLPRWGGRTLSAGPMVVLACAMMLQHATQCIAIYLRAHREEPMLVPSILGAAVLGFGFPFSATRWGVLGVSYWLLVTTLGLGIGVALVLFRAKRKSFVMQ